MKATPIAVAMMIQAPCSLSLTVAKGACCPEGIAGELATMDMRTIRGLQCKHE